MEALSVGRPHSAAPSTTHRRAGRFVPMERRTMQRQRLRSGTVLQAASAAERAGDEITALETAEAAASAAAAAVAAAEFAEKTCEFDAGNF